MMMLTLFATLATSLQAQQRPASATDYYRLTFVANPAMAPSGRQVAFTVTTIVEDKDRRHSEVWLSPTDASGAAPWRLTSPGTEASNPVWSPDGSLLAFNSRRDGTGPDSSTTWFLRMGAAGGGEAFQIAGVNGTPVWSPDGRTIAYLWRGTDSLRGERRRGWVSANAITRGPDPRRFDGRVITYLRFKADERGYTPDPASVLPNHIYVVSADGGTPTLLTPGTLPQGAIAWSPDSRRIAFVQDSTDPDELREDMNPDIWIVDVAGGAPQRLTSAGYQQNPAFSPDGRRLAFNCAAGRGEPEDVCVMDVTGGTPRNLTDRWAFDPGPPRWSADGRFVEFQAEHHGTMQLFRVPSQGGSVQPVTSGLRQMNGFSASRDGRMMAYTSTDVTHPVELYVAAGDGSGERRLTSFNDAYVASTQLVAADTIWFRSVGGMMIEAFLMRPVGYQQGRQYPLVMSIHGGPHTQYGHVYFHEFQMLAGQGYWVLFPNPRGSSGYGHEFTFATRGRWGMEDYQDLMLAVDEAIRRTGAVDTTRLAVLGGSYGGFMTNWIVGHTNRFRVAQTDRSIVNWFSWYGSSDAQGLTEYEFHGFPWQNDSLYYALSPMRFIRNMRTPLLIVHSEDDFRTPITDAEQLFVALRKRRVPVEFVRYPRSYHGLSRTGPPWLLVDRLERIRTWFAHWMGPAGDAPAVGSN